MKENESLATELLHEVKLQAKRWFIAFCVMVGVEVATIGAFLWYISLPIEDTVITQTSDNASENNVVGGNLYGSKTDSKTDAKSGSSADISKETKK